MHNYGRWGQTKNCYINVVICQFIETYEAYLIQLLILEGYSFDSITEPLQCYFFDSHNAEDLVGEPTPGPSVDDSEVNNV